MRRFLPLLLVYLLAACVSLAPQDPPQADFALLDDLVALGRIGPGGGPLVADRGIGGTGTPLTMSSTLQVADRGIGGTGVVGVVTGFGSVFVNGMEIRYDSGAAVDIDGIPASSGALRVGQLVALQTEGSTAAPFARRISVRSEVIGRIESLEFTTGILTVAGQAVSTAPGTWGANQFSLGDWVKVSGLRRPDGTVLASRLDRAPAGMLTVRGRALRDGDTMRVGGLILAGPAANTVQNGQFVVVSGTYATGQSRVTGVVPDTLPANPAAYFGAAAARLLVQAYVEIDKGSLIINGARVPTVSTFSSGPVHGGLAVVSLQRGADGTYLASTLRYIGYRNQPSRGVRGSSPPTRREAPHGHQQFGSPSVDPNENGAPSASGSGGEADPGNPAASSLPAAIVTANSMSTSSIDIGGSSSVAVAPVTISPEVAAQNPGQSALQQSTVVSIQQAASAELNPVSPLAAAASVPAAQVVPAPFVAVPVAPMLSVPGPAVLESGAKASTLSTIPMVQNAPSEQHISMDSSRISSRTVERGSDGRTRIIGSSGFTGQGMRLFTGALKSEQLGRGPAAGGGLPTGNAVRQGTGSPPVLPKSLALIGGRTQAGGALRVHGH